MSELLRVNHLKKYFKTHSGELHAVDDVTLGIEEGTTLGVVGESGCGKSTLSRAILGLVRPTKGEIFFDGRCIRGASAGKMTRRECARKIQVVFQDPLASLNPRHTVREILTEGMLYHGLCDKENARDKAASLLVRVGLPTHILDRYPHEFSGGERQRLCIARAVALEPELLICDEAVSALDLSIRAQILDLLMELKKNMGLSILFISHDIGVVQHVSDRVIVMNRGRIVESGDCSEVLGNPRDEYTRALIASVPRIRRRSA